MKPSLKEFRNINDLEVWSKNSRQIRVNDFERVKKQVNELGQYKPLLIDQDNQILGGRTRYYVYKELGITNVWVSPVNCDSDAVRMKYVLSDNDSPGYWIEETLGEFVAEVKTPEVDFSDYHIGADNTKSVEDLLSDLGPGPAPQSPAGGSQPTQQTQPSQQSQQKKGGKLTKCPNCGHEF